MSITDPQWPRANVWLAGDDPEPELVVVGVPNSSSSLTASRADLAPLEVRDRLERFSTYHSELDVDFGSVRVRDAGNWPVSGLAPVPLMSELGPWDAKLGNSPLRIFLGGDNAITRPLIAGRSNDMRKLGLITFDAHHDVRTLTRGPSNENPIRGLVEEHGLPGRNIVQIGIHSFSNSAPYRRYCNDVGITTVTVDQVDKIGMRAAVDVALNQLAVSCDQIYVDVDIDVLDAVFAPACRGAHPGGLTIRQLSRGVARCAAHDAVTAIDFVEVDPTADIGHQTVDVMAHLFLTAVAGFATR